MKSIVTRSLLIASSLFFFNCARQAGQSLLQDSWPSTETGDRLESFKLYDGRNHTVSDGCDVYTKLDLLYKAGKVDTAKLQNLVVGLCELHVPRDLQEFKITKSENDGCGSVIHSGKTASGSSIEITDHRKRLCENVIPSLLEVKLVREQSERNLYSYDEVTPDTEMSESIKLYEQPDQTVNRRCDVHTKLDLSYLGGAAKVAKLQNRVDGLCEIYAPENTREFTINESKNDSCGSVTHFGESSKGQSIKITDHRGQRCEDYRPNWFVVTIVDLQGERSLYSVSIR